MTISRTCASERLPLVRIAVKSRLQVAPIAIAGGGPPLVGGSSPSGDAWSDSSVSARAASTSKPCSMSAATCEVSVLMDLSPFVTAASAAFPPLPLQGADLLVAAAHVELAKTDNRQARRSIHDEDHGADRSPRHPL